MRLLNFKKRLVQSIIDNFKRLPLLSNLNPLTFSMFGIFLPNLYVRHSNRAIWLIRFLLVFICGREVLAVENTSIYFSEQIPKRKSQTLDLRLSLFTISPFYRTQGLGAGYRIKINRNFSWKVIDFSIYESQNLGLSKKLFDQFRISAVTPPILTQQYLTEAIYSPFIYKWLWIDQKIIWSRVDLSLGLGNATWSELGKVAVSSLGAQFVFNVQADWSVYWSLKNLIYGNPKIEPELEFAVGSEINF